MIRPTSLKAYEAIKRSGLLSRTRWIVYDYLFNHGPMTANEINAGIGGTSWHKRLSELEFMGAVDIVGHRECSISGFDCLLWDVTSRINLRPYTRPSTRVEVLEEQNKHYRETIERIATWLDDPARGPHRMPEVAKRIRARSEQIASERGGQVGSKRKARIR